MTNDQQTPVPCPFCGGQACVTKASCVRYVECNRCGASTRVSYGPDGEAEAVEAWNRRPEQGDSNQGEEKGGEG